MKLKPNWEKASIVTPDLSPMLNYDDLSENSIDALVKKVEDLGINSADSLDLEDKYVTPIRSNISPSKPKDFTSR